MLFVNFSKVTQFCDMTLGLKRTTWFYFLIMLLLLKLLPFGF